MSADKYPCIFSRQMEAIVYVFFCFQVDGPISGGAYNQNFTVFFFKIAVQTNSFMYF